MPKPKPTRGPWKRAVRVDGAELIIASRVTVAEVTWNADSLVQGANANLISAAPEMYEALKDYERLDRADDARLKMRAAIAKAEGTEVPW